MAGVQLSSLGPWPLKGLLIAHNFGLKAPLCKSKEQFEIVRLSAFICAQGKGHFIQKWSRKSSLRCIN